MLDSSGGGHDGTIFSGVRVGVTGFHGSAYDFSGSSSIVRVPDPTGALNPGRAPLIITAYLKIPADLTSDDYNVLEKGHATAVGGAYTLEIAINDGNWHLVECHRTADTVYASVAGVVVKRTVGSIANTIDLTIGGKPNNSHYFRGAADEVTLTIG